MRTVIGIAETSAAVYLTNEEKLTNEILDFFLGMGAEGESWETCYAKLGFTLPKVGKPDKYGHHFDADFDKLSKPVEQYIDEHTFILYTEDCGDVEIAKRDDLLAWLKKNNVNEADRMFALEDLKIVSEDGYEIPF